MSDFEKPLLCVVAMKSEARAINNRRDENGKIDDIPVEVVTTQMGRFEARKTMLEKEISPDSHLGVVILGFCGGLTPSLKTGDVIVATKILSEERQCEYQVPESAVGEMGLSLIEQGVRYRAAPLITRQRIVETSQQRATIFRNTCAEAVDMEAFEIAEAALSRGLRCFVVKVVSDEFSMCLPRFDSIYTQSGFIDPRLFRKVLLSHPGPAMQLALKMKTAGAVLERVVPAIVSTVKRHLDS